jgi:hypothetical protein
LESHGTNLDLRTKQVTIIGFASIGHQREADLKKRLLPLLFGSAWKILDLTIELALASAGMSPRRAGRWSIDEKAAEISNCQALPGFLASSDLWLAMIELYGATKETRHALVHRRVTVDSKSGDLVGFDRQSQPLTPVSVDEQMAFCRFAQRLAEAAEARILRGRVESDLLQQLVVLGRHHNIPIAGSTQAVAPVRLTDDFPHDRRINVPDIMARARSTFPAAQYVDLELELSDGRTLVVELEQAPSEVMTVDLGALPSWMHFT